MRFAASPLMVAVALGLLGPSVLEVEEEDGIEEVSPDEALPVAEPASPAEQPY